MSREETLIQLKPQKNEGLSMASKFLKKNRSLIIYMSRYLLTVKLGERLKTIDELSVQLDCSVGSVTSAIKAIELEGAVALDRKGRNGTFISYLDFQQLISLSEFGNVVCAMPLPYTKEYEGLASGLKKQITMLPFYFAHMRGAGVRAECLTSGIYDIAIMSKLAAEQYVESGELEIAVDLGPHSYVSEHRLICRDGQFSNIKRVGVDPSSPDQRLLTETYFKDQRIEIVDAPYNECLELIANNEIDAAIWYLSDDKLLNTMKLEDISLHQVPDCEKASIAVLTVSKKSKHIKTMLNHLLDTKALLKHQSEVIKGSIVPTY